MFHYDCSLLYQKTKIILWSIHTFWYKGSAENREQWQVRQKVVFIKNISPGLKADFSQRVNKSMKFTFHKSIVNVTPVTNPTPMSKSDKYIVKHYKPRFSPKPIFIRNSELAELGRTGYIINIPHWYEIGPYISVMLAYLVQCLWIRQWTTEPAASSMHMQQWNLSPKATSQ